MATFFATRHGIKRYKTRSGLKAGTSLPQLGHLNEVFNERLPEIRYSIVENWPVKLGDETVMFHELIAESGEAFLLKSYWTDQLSWRDFIKQKIRCFLLGILNDW